MLEEKQTGAWGFLDRCDKNLLYRYAQMLSSGKIFSSAKHTTKDEFAFEKCREGYYLIWFVYRYVLECETLEQAVSQNHEYVLKKYGLINYIRKYAVFIGTETENIVSFRYVEDMPVILEILYCKYPLFKQFNCFMHHIKGVRNKRCLAVKKYYTKKMCRILRERAEEENND